MPTAEAVIISGPYRGGIVALPEEMVAELLEKPPLPEEVDEEIWAMMNEALDRVIASVERLSTELRATTAALRQPAEVV